MADTAALTGAPPQSPSTMFVTIKRRDYQAFLLDAADGAVELLDLIICRLYDELSHVGVPVLLCAGSSALQTADVLAELWRLHGWDVQPAYLSTMTAQGHLGYEVIDDETDELLDVRGRHVIVVSGVVRTGNRLAGVARFLERQCQVAGVTAVTLVHQPDFTLESLLLPAIHSAYQPGGGAVIGFELGCDDGPEDTRGRKLDPDDLFHVPKYRFPNT